MVCLLARIDVQGYKRTESDPAPEDDLSASWDGVYDGLGEIVAYIDVASTKSWSYQNQHIRPKKVGYTDGRNLGQDRMPDA